jgi:hypothetical protein
MRDNRNTDFTRCLSTRINSPSDTFHALRLRGFSARPRAAATAPVDPATIPSGVMTDFLILFLILLRLQDESLRREPI